MSQCQYKHGDYQCPRDAVGGDLCILHDKNVEGKKDCIANLIQEILLQPAHRADFTGAEFPVLDQAFKIEVDKIGVFDHAVFHGYVDFSHMKFKQGWSFIETEFRGDVTFSRLANTGTRMNLAKTEFQKNADFNHVQFTGQASFNGTKFHGRTIFNHCIFHTSMGFIKVEFTGETTFTGCDLPTGPETFQSCDFRRVRILTLRRYLESLDLDSIVWPRWPAIERPQWPKWARKLLRWLNCGRRLVYDEKIDTDRQKILQTYRRLHKYYYDRSNFDLASDFYVGFMVMKRRTAKAKRYLVLPWLIDVLFSCFSKYGESMLKPFFTALFLWLTIPLVIMWLEPTTSGGISHWWDIFWKNLMASTLYRSNDWVDTLSDWPKRVIFIETILNATLLGLFALGVRRHFVPKKPLDEKT